MPSAQNKPPRLRRGFVPALALAVTLTGLTARAGSADAQTWTLETSGQQAALLELYTSQGCSSCPPADRWLSQFEDSPDLFSEVVPIAFHVTYWDYLGWQDPLGLDAHSRRHRQEAARARSGVYTPGVFLQGHEWRSWRRHPTGPALGQQPTVGVLTADAKAGKVDVTWTPTQSMNPDAPPIAFVSYLRMNQSTAVKRGENRGRQLEHDFAAGRVHRVAMAWQDGAWRASLAAATPEGAGAVAVWLRDLDGKHLQAGGRLLPPGS